MKPIIVKSLDVHAGDSYWTYLPDLPRKRSKNVAPPVRAGSCELVLTALVSEECVNFRVEGFGCNDIRGSANLASAFNSFCEVARLKGYKKPFSVTLKIEPVDRAAKVDAAR
jgi:hypothetical protein